MAWNKPKFVPTTSYRPKNGNRVHSYCLLFAAIFVVIGILSTFLIVIFKTSDVPVLRKETGKASNSIREKFKANSAAKHMSDARSKGQDLSLDNETLANEYSSQFPGEKILNVATNAAGYIQVECLQPNGKQIVHIVTPPPIFDHVTDELILAVLNTPEGQQMPPLPPNLGGLASDVKFNQSLNTPIIDKPGDSDRIKAYKAIVRSARLEIAERLNNGEHFTDIIYDQHMLRNENSKIYSDASKELKSIIKSGDAENARVYYQKMNAMFEKMGIKPLKNPCKQSESGHQGDAQ